MENVKYRRLKSVSLNLSFEILSHFCTIVLIFINFLAVPMPTLGYIWWDSDIWSLDFFLFDQKDSGSLITTMGPNAQTTWDSKRASNNQFESLQRKITHLLPFSLLLKGKTKGNEGIQWTVPLEVCLFIWSKKYHLPSTVWDKLPKLGKTRTNLNTFKANLKNKYLGGDNIGGLGLLTWSLVFKHIFVFFNYLFFHFIYLTFFKLSFFNLFNHFLFIFAFTALHMIYMK